MTALIASAVWIGVTSLTGGTSASFLPVLGPVFAIVAYIVVIDIRYPGTIVRATGIAVLTWAIDFVILYGLALVGISSFEIIGVPPGI